MTEQLNAGLVLKEAYVTENPSKRFTTEQKQWIREREGGAFYPILNNEGNLSELVCVPKQYVNVHHIHTIAHNRDYFGDRDPNHPLNGIALPVDFHNRLHRDWVESYWNEYEEMPVEYRSRYSKQAYVATQTSQGKPSWLHKFDEVLTSIAVINSYYFLKRERPFPFKEEYVRDIKNAFEWVEPNFKDRYLWLRKKPKGTPIKRL